MGGEGIVPEEADQCSDKRSTEDYQFLTSGDVHDVEIVGKTGMTGEICQDDEGYAHDGRVTGAESIHAVIEVGTVAHCHNDEGGNTDEEDPTCCLLPTAQELEESGIVEVMILDKGQCGECGFDEMSAFAHHSIGSEPKSESDTQSEYRLSEQFDDGTHTVLVLLAILCRCPAEFTDLLEEKWHTVVLFAMALEIIIEKAEQTEPKGGE